MMGAIAGDVVGSVYEATPLKSTDFELFVKASRFTDDTVMTVAVADAILHENDYASSLRRWGRRYPNAGYGAGFYRWLMADGAGPYQSWGNGAAMRVSPVGFALDSEEQVLREAARSASVSHDHPEGIKGAQATALAVWLALHGHGKQQLRERIETEFGYDLGRSLEQIRPGYAFDVSCQGSVPESLIAFLESRDVESAIRNAVSLGGDSDTMACIAGAVAEAFYGPLPTSMRGQVLARLPDDMQQVVTQFEQRFQPAYAG